MSMLLPAGGYTEGYQPSDISWPHHYRHNVFFRMGCLANQIKHRFSWFFSFANETWITAAGVKAEANWTKNLLEQLPIFSSLTQLIIWDSDFAVGILCSYSKRWRQLGTCARCIGFQEVLSAGSEFLTHRTREVCDWIFAFHLHIFSVWIITCNFDVQFLVFWYGEVLSIVTCWWGGQKDSLFYFAAWWQPWRVESCIYIRFQLKLYRQYQWNFPILVSFKWRSARKQRWW